MSTGVVVWTFFGILLSLIVLNSSKLIFPGICIHCANLILFCTRRHFFFHLLFQSFCILMFAMSFYFSASSFYFSFFSYHICSDQELFYSIFSFYWLWSYTLIFYSFDDWAVTLKITKCIANSPRSKISFYLCMLWSKLTQDLRTEHHLPHSFLCAAFFLYTWMNFSPCERVQIIKKIE